MKQIIKEEFEQKWTITYLDTNSDSEHSICSSDIMKSVLFLKNKGVKKIIKVEKYDSKEI